jgi:hypothetical protein
MPELQTMETPKTAGFVNPNHNNRNRRRIEEDEKEIQELEGKPQEEEEVAVEATEEDAEDKDLSREEKSFKKRYGDLRRHMADKEKDWNERFENLEKSSTNIIPPKSDEDIEQWASEYPDIAGIVETIAAKKAQELFSKADSRLQKLDELQNEAVRKTAETTIMESHSDFVKIRESDEFHGWADEQPKWVQDAVYENADDPYSVVRVLDLYKSDKGLTKQAKKAGTKAAASMVSKTSKTKVDADDSDGQIRESDIAKMSSKDFETNLDEINKAMRTGKFVYDISGNAR